MLKMKVFTIVLPILLVLTGCNLTPSSQINDQKIKELEEKITMLEEKVNMLDKLEGKIIVLEEKVNMLNKIVATYESGGAILSPEEKGYSVARSSAGYFFISLDNIEQYLDGYKIYIMIGNPSNATFNGFKLKVVWGKDLLQITRMEEAQNFKTYNFVESLKPGFWTKVNFVIPSVKSEDLKYIKISVETDVIRLYEE